MAKVLNLSTDEECGMCGDDGWCVLKGTVRVRGVTYERGNAPCRWCERGARAYARNPGTESEYDADDVIAPVPDAGPGWRAEGRRRLQELRSRTGSIGREMP